jgi:hypothetical protein
VSGRQVAIIAITAGKGWITQVDIELFGIDCLLKETTKMPHYLRDPGWMDLKLFEQEQP